MKTSRYQRTHERLFDGALNLFETQGFEQTTVSQIADMVGVTEMTFFRHFPSKEMVVLADPYDPAIVDAIAAQPVVTTALIRTVGGFRQALRGLSEPESELVRRRIRIVATSAALRASSVGVNTATEAKIAEQLIADGAPELEARAVSAAVLAALTAALYEWARDEQLTLPAAIDSALRALE